MTISQWYVNIKVGRQCALKRLKLKRAGTKKNHGKRTTLTDQRRRSRHRPMARKCRNGLGWRHQWRSGQLEKMVRHARSVRSKSGVRRPHKRIVLWTCKLGSGPRIVAWKKRTTRGQVRGVARKKNPRRLQRQISKPDPDLRETKIRARGGRKEFADERKK